MNLRFGLYLLVACLCAACGGSSGTSQKFYDLSKAYQELQLQNNACFEVGLNDRSQITLNCIQYNAEGSYQGKKIFLISKDNEIKELPVPRQSSETEFMFVSPITNNGTFSVQVYEPIGIGQSTSISAAGQNEFFIWRDGAYETYQGVQSAMSDNGEYCAALSSDVVNNQTKQLLISSRGIEELQSNDGTFPNMNTVTTTNDGVQYGYASRYTDTGEYIGYTLLSWSKLGQSIIPLRAENAENDSLIEVNNHGTILFSGYALTAEGQIISDFYLQHKNGEIESIPSTNPSIYFNFVNDNNIVLGSSFDSATFTNTYYVYSKKRGVVPLAHVAPLPEGKTYQSVIALNNKNEVLAIVSNIDGSFSTRIMRLDDIN